MKQLILLLFISGNLYSQSLVKFSGLVVSSKDNLPVPFVNIRVLNKTIGTVTNTDGIFEVQIKDTLKKIQVILSHVNYRDTVVSITRNENKINNKILLTEQSIVLNPVEVYSDYFSYEIILAAKRKLSSFFPDKELFLKTYYKEIINKDSLPARYSEAFFNIYLPTLYKKDSTTVTDKKRKIALLANRNYFSYKDTLVNICQSPYKILTNVFVDVVPLDTIKYEYSIIANLDKSYILNVTPKPNILLKYSYECAIDKETKTFNNIRIYVSESTFKNHPTSFRNENSKNTFSIFSKYFTDINFIKIEGYSHIASIHNYVKEKFIDDRINYVTEIERNSYLFINEEYKNKIKLKNVMKQGEYLHEELSNTDQQFWDSQNKLIQTLNDEIIIKQIK